MTQSSNQFRSPLSRAKGLGSAKSGVHHWWMQRLTGMVLIPLLLWLIFSLAMLAQADYATTLAWLNHPFSAIALIVLSLALFYHSSLGLQVVIEDYVHIEWLKVSSILLVNLLNFILAVISIFYLLKIVFGAST